jgi:glycosyltransferase involved in cell wall biosynthesis
LLLCKALAERGHRAVLVFSNDLQPDIEARLRASGADIIAINYEKGVAHYFRKLGDLVRMRSIDTVHIAFFDYFGAIGWLARLHGVRHILYEMQNSGVFKATSWKRDLLRLRTKAATAPMTVIVAISNFVKEQLLKAGVAERKLVVRYLGVDSERFVPDARARQRWVQDFAIRPEEVILSTVSYLRPFKRPEVLVAACKELADRNVPVRLFVGGGGAMLPDLQSLSRRLGLEERIHWLGDVADPRSLLQASDIFVLASVGEAFGLVLTEAMSCGVPVVGSDSGSLPEVVARGNTGILVEPGSATAFADAIEQICKDPALRREMGTRARQRVLAKFTVDKAVDETLRIYERLWQTRDGSAE